MRLSDSCWEGKVSGMFTVSREIRNLRQRCSEPPRKWFLRVPVPFRSHLSANLRAGGLKPDKRPFKIIAKDRRGDGDYKSRRQRMSL